MARSLHFLGWDAPVTALVRTWLLPETSGPFDLSNTLVLVPTRQAARRLREALAVHADAGGWGLLSPTIMTPGTLLREDDATLRDASPVAISAAWTALLRGIDPSRFSALFPRAPVVSDPGWAVDTGAQIQTLRSQLAEGGYTIARVAQLGAEVLEEAERWRDLSQLETQYLERLHGLGLRDPHSARIRASLAPPLPESCERVVVACVPDPNLLAIAALERLAERLPVDVLVQAPKAMSEHFDAWGRPEREHWSACELDLPSIGPGLQLSATPCTQAADVVAAMAASADTFGPTDIAIGVPDRDVIPYLERAMQEHGLSAYDPAESPLAEHALFHLLDAVIDLVRKPDYRSVRTLLRNGELLDYLARAEQVSPTQVLGDLDRMHNAYLPRSLRDLRTACDRERQVHAARVQVDANLLPALKAIDHFRRLFEGGAPIPAMQTVLQDLFSARTLRSGNPADDEFESAARRINDAMMQVADTALVPLGLEGADQLLLLRRVLADAEYPRERSADKRLDLEGWLELSWNDAPFLIVTGMNEGAVPDGRLADPYLPDSLRTRLNLPNDGSRLARDAYLLQAILSSRRAHGRTVLLVGKRSAQGDPLKPSRLLFRCPQDELADRAEYLFGEAAENREQVAATISFPLEPMHERLQAARETITSLGVTSFASYLACPFRFFLSDALNMKRLVDDKDGPDALDFGVMVHHALEQMVNEEEIWRCGDAAQLSGFLGDQAAAWCEARFGARPALPVRIALDAAQQRLHAAAVEQVRIHSEGWEIIAGEQRCEIEIAGLTVVGKVDRVDRHASSGRLRVIDYKTSDAATTPEAAHLARARDGDPEYQCFALGKKRYRWTNLQLPLYAHMFRDEGDVDVAYFALPKSVTQTGLQVWEDFDDSHLASALQCAEGVIEAIHAQRFWPPARVRADFDDFAPLFAGHGPDAIDSTGMDA